MADDVKFVCWINQICLGNKSWYHGLLLLPQMTNFQNNMIFGQVEVHFPTKGGSEYVLWFRKYLR